MMARVSWGRSSTSACLVPSVRVQTKRSSYLIACQRQTLGRQMNGVTRWVSLKDRACITPHICCACCASGDYAHTQYRSSAGRMDVDIWYRYQSLACPQPISPTLSRASCAPRASRMFRLIADGVEYLRLHEEYGSFCTYRQGTSERGHARRR